MKNITQLKLSGKDYAANWNTAFTLAEVLITLAIIGVVAAMTIPTLVQKYQERVMITKVKKFYSVITNAANLAMLEHGTLDTWDLPTSVLPNEDNSNQDEVDAAHARYDLVWQRILPYLKVDKFCSFASQNCGQIYSIYNLRGDQLLSSEYARHITLADGTSIVSSWFEGNCNLKFGSGRYLENVCGNFVIDMNGEKGPNRTGVDSFRFLFTKYGIYPTGTHDSTLSEQYIFDKNCNMTHDDIYAGYACTAWVIINGNMDYLRCNDLDWGSKTKCD